jgi:hypothetical protein
MYPITKKKVSDNIPYIDAAIAYNLILTNKCTCQKSTSVQTTEADVNSLRERADRAVLHDVIPEAVEPPGRPVRLILSQVPGIEQRTVNGSSPQSLGGI